MALLVNGWRGLVLAESKLTEHSFYRCSARQHETRGDREGNPDPGRCKNVAAVLASPSTQCHQAAWGRTYWTHLAPVARLDGLSACPAASAGYQLFRQQALAEGLAASGRYDLVASCVAIDARNTELAASMRDSGIADVRDWGALFEGKARFAVFTHQDWVAWVRDSHDAAAWSDWLRYVEDRYLFNR